MASCNWPPVGLFTSCLPDCVAKEEGKNLMGTQYNMYVHNIWKDQIQSKSHSLDSMCCFTFLIFTRKVEWNGVIFRCRGFHKNTDVWGPLKEEFF